MKRAALALVLLGPLGAMPAVAHHSFDLTFDRDKQIGLTGTVTEFSFANPHSYFKLEVVDADGNAQEWHVETTSGWQLSSHGWDQHSIKPGETLSVKGFGARNGRPYVKLQSMSHANGGAVALWLPSGPSTTNGS
jgi:hypothetical protein